MKGTIRDFLKLATEKPKLARDIVSLAAKYDFEFTDEVSDEQLDSVAGGSFWASLTTSGRSVGEATKQISSSVLPIAGAGIGTAIGAPSGAATGSELGEATADSDED